VVEEAADIYVPVAASSLESHADGVVGGVVDRPGRRGRSTESGVIRHGAEPPSRGVAVVHLGVELLGQLAGNARRAHLVSAAHAADLQPRRGCARDAEPSPGRIGGNVARIGLHGGSRREVGEPHMPPEEEGLVGDGGRIPVAIDDPVALAARGRGRERCAGHVRGDLDIVAGQRLELVLVRAEISGDDAKVICELLHPDAADELLALEHSAHEQADDHQHDGNLDQREAGLSLSCLHLPRGNWMCARPIVVEARWAHSDLDHQRAWPRIQE